MIIMSIVFGKESLLSWYLSLPGSKKNLSDLQESLKESWQVSFNRVQGQNQQQLFVSAIEN